MTASTHKNFVTSVFFKRLTRFWCPNIRKFRQKSSTDDKTEAVNILDFWKAIEICKSVISSTFGYMILVGIFTPSSIFPQ